MIRQVFPTLIAQQILGVQPMAGSVGSIFTMLATYEDSNIAKFHKKYKFSRAKWYYCEFNPVNNGKISAWCKEHFGPLSVGGDAWMRWKKEGLRVRFRDEDDAIMFKLRWSK